MNLIKCAIIKDGVVINVIEYESVPIGTPDGFEDGHTAVEADAVSIGWLYDGTKFTDPTPPPTPIEMPKQQTLVEQILASPSDLAALKTALGIA